MVIGHARDSEARRVVGFCGRPFSAQATVFFTPTLTKKWTGWPVLITTTRRDCLQPSPCEINAVVRRATSPQHAQLHRVLFSLSQVEIYVEVTQTEVFIPAAEAWNDGEHGRVSELHIHSVVIPGRVHFPLPRPT